ncbi:MAG: mevalonate kinase [Archaeoglobaceae archaeon]
MLASAPGKIILFGEHAVVYGRHAVVAAIDLRCRVRVERASSFRIESPLGVTGLDFKVHPYVSFAIKRFGEIKKIEGARIRIESEVPIGSGLGSSAAVAVATLKALDAEFETGMSDEEIFRLAWQVEKDVQGTSSGIDPFVSTYGGCWLFPERKRLEVRERFFVLNFGSRSTAKMVAKVAELRKRYPDIVERIFDAIDAVALNAASGAEIEELIPINHSLLRAIGVSTPEIDEKIAELEREGLRAKITGAGGGGCVYGVYRGRAPEGAIVVGVSDEGARVEGS